jgi:hypothetical protein
MFVVAYAS